MNNIGNIIDARVLNIILLSAINVIKQISGIDLIKKHIFSAQENLSINADILLIKISGDINGDFVLKFDKNLKEKVLEGFLKNFSEFKESNNAELEHSAFVEIGNLITAKISNYLSVDKKNVDISSVQFISKKDEINYENIFGIDLTSNWGELSIYLGIKELKLERSLVFLFFGFSEELIEEITNEFIPKGFEIYYTQSHGECIEILKSKRIDIAIIDFYVINQDLKIFLKSYFSAIQYKINLIFGITKIDTIKFQGIPTNSENYQIIGLFLKTFSKKEIINYIYSILQKIGIKTNDRRKHVRVNITDNSRYFVSVNEKDIKFTAKLKDISLGGFRAEIDNLENKNALTIGRVLNSVDMFLKYNRLKISCKIVSVNENIFSASFVNLIEQDRNIISNSIFKILCNK